MTLYKITHPDGRPVLAETPARWPLPTGERPGKWTPDATPVLCYSGWHLMPVEGLSSHIAVGTLWEAEGRRRSVGDPTKTAYTSARLVRRVGEITRPMLVSLACDWAEHVQPDPVPAESAAAIAAARVWAACPCEEHATAANAAYAAAYAAYAGYAGYAAYAACAAYAAYAAYASAYAVRAAAYAAYAAYAVRAACAAAYAVRAACAAADAASAAYASYAASYVAYASERVWQGERVLEVVAS